MARVSRRSHASHSAFTMSRSLAVIETGVSRRSDSVVGRTLDPRGLPIAPGPSTATVLFTPMRVLVVYAHPNPGSFCHAVIERVQSGLEDGGHRYEVIDLYAIGFDPVFRMGDSTQFIHESLPRDLLED